MTKCMTKCLYSVLNAAQQWLMCNKEAPTKEIQIPAVWG